MNEISPQIESGQIPEKHESKGIWRSGVDRAMKALHAINRRSQRPFSEALAEMRQSRAELPAHEGMEESPFPGAEKHVFTRQDPTRPLEYFTQSLYDTPSNGWKNLMGSDEEVVAVIGDNNTLGWAQRKQKEGYVLHRNVLSLLGKNDLAETNKFTRITFKPAKHMIELINFEGVGIDTIRPILNYFRSGLGNSAGKIKVDYSEQDSEGRTINFMRPLNKL